MDLPHGTGAWNDVERGWVHYGSNSFPKWAAATSMTKVPTVLLALELVVGAVFLSFGENSEKQNEIKKEDRMASNQQKNIDAILTIFEAIERRDERQMLQRLDPDFEIQWPSSLPYGGTFHGLKARSDGWSATWEPLQPTEAERKMDPRVVAAHSDDAVVLWRQRGLNPAGDRFEGEVLGLYQFRDGKLTRAQMFYFDTVAVANFLAKAKNTAMAPNL